MEDLTQLLSRCPFLTYLTYGGNEYFGIIQNADEQITTIYDFDSLRSDDEKRRFLELGEIWWWESNRLNPINVFLKKEWADFRYSAKTMISKDVKIKAGPSCCLKELNVKRSKRRSIILVRKVR